MLTGFSLQGASSQSRTYLLVSLILFIIWDLAGCGETFELFPAWVWPPVFPLNHCLNSELYSSIMIKGKQISR